MSLCYLDYVLRGTSAYLPRFHEESQSWDSIWMHSHPLQYILNTSASPCGLCGCGVLALHLTHLVSYSEKYFP